MSPGPRRNAVDAGERLILDPAERREALLDVIGAARERLALSLFRCNDFAVLDALAAALERGCEVHALLTKRAKGGRKKLQKLWGALEEMGAVVSWYADPVVKYHAKYVVADAGPAVIATLNPTRKCFTKTWDCLVVTNDAPVVRSLAALFESDTTGKPLPRGTPLSARLVVGPEHARAQVWALIGSAQRSIRILDHKLSDPDVVALLRERRAQGITVSVVGGPLPGALEPHGKLMLVDESSAVIGSMALSTLSLDFRREVSIIVTDPALVRRLNAAFQQLSARAGASAALLPGDHTR